MQPTITITPENFDQNIAALAKFFSGETLAIFDGTNLILPWTQALTLSVTLAPAPDPELLDAINQAVSNSLVPQAYQDNVIDRRSWKSSAQEKPEGLYWETSFSTHHLNVAHSFLSAVMSVGQLPLDDLNARFDVLESHRVDNPTALKFNEGLTQEVLSMSTGFLAGRNAMRIGYALANGKIQVSIATDLAQMREPMLEAISKVLVAWTILRGKVAK